ncbi:hypothetical protein [Lignipirellula cremea]|uniref:Uncharacterized protein n=1 Tax=Lignipirellula cremea TaxID=2528010 RepID=A0A518DTT7_9BACT|nr:hypothetical protein [Lignipirellula cremea]QDU95239.1 hypothetical protein Pla8534_30540 [Lignipirellula cremea]
MPFTVNDLFFGVLLPALLVLVILFAMSRVKALAAVEGLLAPLALAIGFEAGYWMLGLGPASPTSHWHWLAYVVGLGVLAGALAQAFGGKLPLTVGLFLPCTLACGWWLIPTWDSLEPSREVHLAVWTVATTALVAGGHPIFMREQKADRLAAVIVVFLLVTAASILLVLADSLRFAQMAMALSGAIAGLVVAVAADASRKPLLGILPFTVIALCGLLLIGQVNSFSGVPLASYLLIPAAMFGMGIARIPAIAKRGLRWSFCVSIAVPAMLSVLALGLAVWAVFGEETY